MTLMKDFQKSKDRFNELNGLRTAKQKLLRKALADKEELEKMLTDLINVQALLQTTTSAIYANLSSSLGDIITEGLSIVFPEENYKFVIRFEEKRNKVEVSFVLIDDVGEEFDPVNDVGGGVADIISILLRITYIVLSRHQNILIADEPLKFVDRDRIELAATFINKVAKELKFQILMVTHIPEFTQIADTVYAVSKSKKISRVRKVK